MPISQIALKLENRSIGFNGEPTLADAYEILKKQWRNGDRDRELGLHLIFLTWYGLVEPRHLTGFSENEHLTRELNQMLSEVHVYFEPQIYQDAEMLYVVGLAANMFWYMFEDAPTWEQRAIYYQKRYRALAPNGIECEVFQNRGAYGEYYAGHTKLEGGY